MSQPAGATAAPRRILIVDDSVVARAVIGRIVAAGERWTVAGAVATAPAALAFLARERVDAILLDIEMPGVDGLAALPEILRAGAGAPVLIVSTACGDGALATLQALALGAADTLVKPVSGRMVGFFAEQVVLKLERLFRGADQPVLGPVGAPVVPERAAYDVVAIGASTGGIHALSLLLRAIPPARDVPIMITQHLPESFMPHFATQVAILAGRPCDVAADRMRVRPGRVLLAPGDAHMVVTPIGEGGAAVRLTHEPAPSGCRPSVDPMFASVANVYGPRALGVVLSGMGRDGADGVRRIADAGGRVVAQDKASSVVWGMPGAAIATGRAAAALPPEEIGHAIAAGRWPA